MKWKMALFCIALWLFFGFIPVFHSAQKDSKFWNHQKKNSAKRFCDPSFIQKCSSGFYRERAGPHQGRCVPCSCSGLSDVCDELTGSCVNCQFNTTGDHCERCKDGYYGNAANRTCHACPCPFTQNNSALGCVEISSGVVECSCNRGYSGTRCERCAFGYYGNPSVHGGICKPCDCTDSNVNACDSLTGKCITCGHSSCGENCLDCVYSLQEDSGRMDVDLMLLKQQLQSIAHRKNISDIKIQVSRFSAAVKHLDPKVEQLGMDAVAVKRDLTVETHHITSDLENVVKSLEGSQFQVQDLLSDATVLLTTVKDLIRRQTLVKSEDSFSENHKSQMMEEAQQTVQEIRNRECTSQRDRASSEKEKTLKLLNHIRNNVTAETLQDVREQIDDSLTAANISMAEISELLLKAKNTSDKTQGLNLKPAQHLQHVLSQLETEQNTLHPVTVMAQNLLKKITDIFLTLDKFKDELENLVVQIDGAKLEVFRKLNNQLKTKVDTVIKAEEHAEEVMDLTTDLQQVFHSAINSTERLRIMDASGAYSSITKTLKKAALEANQSRGAAEQTLGEVKEGSLMMRAEETEDKAARSQTEANNTLEYFQLVSHSVNALNSRVNKQEKERKLMNEGVLMVKDDVKRVKREDTEVLTESVKAAASAANSRVINVKKTLNNISVEVERLTNIRTDTDDVLIDVEQALKSFSRKLPVLTDRLSQIIALSGKTPPTANITESIRRIKDVIDETRNFVNSVSAASTFNGRSHIELHPPRNMEDIKTFTAVDLLINRHLIKPSVTDNRRKRRQNKHRDSNLFVFYLGNQDASGDYIGMAIRNSVLICVYKLGGVIHEVETSQIRSSNVNSSDFDRVVFQRIYQDAEVKITQNFTLKNPVNLPPKRNLPNNTMSGVFSLDPERAAVYVGGYPEDFTPPIELRYAKYRGAMKLSYINDNPVSLYNFKHAVNMDSKQPAVMVPWEDVSDYYDGTGFRMAFIKEPNMKKRRLFKFHTNSRETNAFLFYIENEESYFCVFLERGYLVLQGQQADKELRVQSPDRVSLLDKQFAVSISDRVVVRYGSEQISTDHILTTYTRFYMGGLPAWLRQRYNLTAAPLRGCVDRLTADAESVEYSRTVGVRGGCPVSLLGVRAAAVFSSLPADSLLALNEEPIRVSLGFRSSSRHAVLLSSSSQGSASVHDLQLSLADGFILFRSYNYSLVSDKRYSDGAWHYLSAEGRPTGLKLNIDNVNVVLERSSHISLQGQKFKGCVANIYSRRPDQRFTPADLSVLSQTEDIVPGWCDPHPPSHGEFLTEPGLKKPQKHKPIKTLTGSHCRRHQNQHEYRFSESQSWLRYTVPQEELNYRPHFSLHIKTTSSKGLILHAEGRGAVPLLALYMANGKIRMSLGYNRTIQHKQKTNDQNWHMVEFSVEKNSFHLLVDGLRVTDGPLPNSEGSSLQLENLVHLGADPKRRTTKEHSIPVDSIIGCIREFRMNDVAVSEPDSSHEVLPCFAGPSEMGTYFGGGHLVSEEFFTLGSHFVLSFELHPQHLTGLLFHFQRDNQSSLSVHLMKTKMVVDLNDGNGPVSVTVTPHTSLCDGKFHMVTVSKQHAVIKLVVDSMSEQEVSSSASNSSAPHSLYIGGTKTHGVPVSPPFVGCLRNVKLNGESVGFETGFRVFGFVNINRCPAN